MAPGQVVEDKEREGGNGERGRQPWRIRVERRVCSFALPVSFSCSALFFKTRQCNNPAKAMTVSAVSNNKINSNFISVHAVTITKIHLAVRKQADEAKSSFRNETVLFAWGPKSCMVISCQGRKLDKLRRACMRYESTWHLARYICSC